MALPFAIAICHREEICKCLLNYADSLNMCISNEFRYEYYNTRVGATNNVIIIEYYINIVKHKRSIRKTISACIAAITNNDLALTLYNTYSEFMIPDIVLTYTNCISLVQYLIEAGNDRKFLLKYFRHKSVELVMLGLNGTNDIEPNMLLQAVCDHNIAVVKYLAPMCSSEINDIFPTAIKCDYG
jgi:hypothetical protein